MARKLSGPNDCVGFSSDRAMTVSDRAMTVSSPVPKAFFKFHQITL